MLISGVAVFELSIGGGARGPQTHVLHDAVDVVDEDGWEIVTGLDMDAEELKEDEGSVAGLDVETSCCCNEIVSEEALKRNRLVPVGTVNGSALAAQHRMAAHNRGSLE